MKKQALLAVAVLMVFIFSGCNKKTPQGQQPIGGEVEKKEMAGEQKKEGFFSGSLKDLMNKGDSQKCVWSFSDPELGDTSGTVYLSGKKFFQEFSSVGPQGEMKSYILNDEEWVYQWTSLSTMGTKINVAEAEKLAENVPSESPVPVQPEGEAPAVDWDKEMNYQCENWNVDASKFQLPAGIQFTDLNEMLKATQQNIPPAMGDLCKMCESLPVEAKADCLKSCAQ